jgi:hypothetical protein
MGKVHKLARVNKISRDNSQLSPHNIQKHQVAKALVENDKIQDLTNHKQTFKWGDAK